jgi:hypothetical protein
MEYFWKPDLNANRHGLQWKAFNSQARCLLLSGPRYSGKTIAALNKIVRHMWDTPGASVAMFSKTMKNSKEGGTWLDMHRSILPPWIDAKIGLDYTSLNNDGQPGWKVIGDTRTPYFKIRNRYGGESECRLFSLDHVPDVVDKVKEQRFSLIYFSELMKFNDRIVLSATMPCLRMMHLHYEDQFWMADTNPSEEGDQSWIYKLWFQERLWSYEQYVENCKELAQEPESVEEFKRAQSELELIEMYPEDNLKLDPRVLSELKRHCSYDNGLYQRDVKGKWVFGDGDASRHFRAFFKPNLHVLGNAESPVEDDWEFIKPSPGSSELVLGFDPGDINHAAVIMDQTYVNNRKHFAVLEELESLKQNVSVEEFALEFMDLIKTIELDAGRTFNLDRAYSDASALEKYSAAGDTYPAMEIRAASLGRISLIGVPKPSGSVRVRVNLVKQLLSQERLKISAQCTGLQRMFRDLKKGSGRLNYVVGDENKHIFDALTYPLIMECAEELVTQEDRMSVGPSKTLLLQV